jgi:hypothetical protein
VTIETANGPLTLISCYHRSQDRLRDNDITNILDTGASVIAAGDFNSKHLTWGSRETNRNGRILFDLADATDFRIEAPPEPTHYDSRGYRADILDIALIKNVPFQIRLHVSLALNSDHMPVLMHIGDEANDANTNITIRTTNWPRFAEILETDFGPIPRIESVEDLESAAGALEDKIKSDRLNSNSGRAATKRDFATMDRRSNSRKESCQAPCLSDWRRSRHNTEANRLGNEVKYALIDHRSDRWETKLESLTTEDNSIWRMAKALRSNHKPLPPIQGANGLVLSDVDKAEAFADSLELQCTPNVVDADPVHIEEIENQVRLILSRHDDNPITPASPSEIRKIIGSLKKKKAPGPDNISNTALKLLPPKVVVALAAIFNASLRLCHFRSRWKNATVTFIPKPGKNSKLP